MSHQNTVFHQLLKPILRQDFERLTKQHHHGQKLRSATRWDQFIALLMSQLSCRQSLRDIQSNLESQQEKLYHLGAKRIARSTLARINEEQPAELRKTLTYDRGREMAEHTILEQDLGMAVYFCDPHSPWQKGTYENMNGLIRQYLPKGIDLSQADQHYLNQVAMSLNTRPRKALDWHTSLEMFAQLVDYHQTFKSVAPHV